MMVAPSEIDALLDMARPDVLSISVDVDPTRPEHQSPHPAYRIWLQRAVQEAVAGIGGPGRSDALQTARQVLAHVEGSRPRGRGLVIFAASTLWREYWLPFPLPNRVQFGRPLASFQAVRHRLAETFVALEGAEAALTAADSSTSPGLSALLAKAAAGQAALTAARHCQQVLGGIGFTAEHGLHRHVRRALVLDGLLGSARELTREAGTLLVKERSAQRLVGL